MRGIDTGKSGITDVAANGIVIHTNEGNIFWDGYTNLFRSFDEDGSNVVTRNENPNGEGKRAEPGERQFFINGAL